jgi:hypothetical protein
VNVNAFVAAQVPEAIRTLKSLGIEIDDAAATQSGMC